MPKPTYEELLKEQKLHFFTTARISAQGFRTPPDQGFKPCFRPTIGGELVRPTGMPFQGYETREEAIAGGRAYRAACVAALAEG